MFERELGRGLKLSAIFKPLNSRSRFGCDIKLELHIRLSLVFDLVEILLRYFNLWGTWRMNQKTGRSVLNLMNVTTKYQL